jgi:hypothetical protein
VERNVETRETLNDTHVAMALEAKDRVLEAEDRVLEVEE